MKLKFGNRTFVIPEETELIVIISDETDLGTEYTTVRLRDKEGKLLELKKEREPTATGEGSS